MICPYCKGTGKSNMWINGGCVPCTACKGTGNMEVTNEQWIRLCTTEQLTDVLLRIADSCYWAGFFKGKDDDDGYDDEYCLINQNIVEWLKQPHTPEGVRK